MNQLLKEVSTIAAAIIGLAILAVLVSRQGRGVEFVNAVGNLFQGSIRAATNPFQGGGMGVSAYGGNSFMSSN